MAVAAHASPQLAPFDPECLPGIGEAMIAFMQTQEARHWPWRFMEGLATESMIENRFSSEVAEVFSIWTAVRDDLDRLVRNCGDVEIGRANPADRVLEEADESDAAAVIMDHARADVASLVAGEPGRIPPEAEGERSHDDGDESSEEAEKEHQEGEPHAVGEAGVAEGDTEAMCEKPGDETIRDARAEGSGYREGSGLRGDEESVGVAEGGDHDADHDHGCRRDERDEVDAIDPHTRIPTRWSEWLRAVNANQSLGVEIAGGEDSAISDGLNTLPGNYVEPTQQAEIDGAALPSAAGGSGTENRTTTAIETAEGNSGLRQTDLKAWLK